MKMSLWVAQNLIHRTSVVKRSVVNCCTSSVYNACSISLQSITRRAIFPSINLEKTSTLKNRNRHIYSDFTKRAQFHTSEGNMKAGNGDDEVVEQLVCAEEDIPDDGTKLVELNGNKVLLVKTGGSVYAVGGKCSHYGLSLENAPYCDGRIRCPFHGACFNVETGDIEDFPGLDSLPTHKVEVVDGQVKVTARAADLERNKRVKKMARRDKHTNKTFVVVGGGAAGAKCVETLRQEGFSGRLVLMTSESALPYDRPKLSKAMHLTADELSLRSTAFYQEMDVDVKLDSPAVRVETESKQVFTTSGNPVGYDKLFVATGGRPRPLGVPGADLAGVFVLRSPSDANAIVDAAKGKRVVVVGSSFIGMEVAAYLSSESRSASVTVIGSSATPFERSFGADVGQRLQRLFETNGVAFVNGARITGVEGADAVEKVKYNDGEEVACDVVVAGIGITPATDLLEGCGVLLDSHGFVLVDEQMRTSVDDVFCGGDCARFPLFLLRQEAEAEADAVSVGHWGMALTHGHTAALAMLDKGAPLRSVPFFWSMMYGKSIRYTGFGAFDEVVIAGSLDDLAFIAYFCANEKVVGVASCGKDPAVANYANMLQQGRFLTKSQVLADGDAALNFKC